MKRTMVDARIIVVEDQLLLGHDIIDRLKYFGYQNVSGPYASAEQAWQEVKNDLPDVALLDINLSGKMTGVDLASKLLSKGAVRIIYLSSRQDDEAFDMTLKTAPEAFLNKPFTNNELKMAVMKALNSEHTPEIQSGSREILNDRIFVKNGRGRFAILLDDILWIKSNGGDTAVIMTADRLELKDKMLPTVALNLSKIEERLSFYPHLTRASRYFIINTKQVLRVIDHQEAPGSPVKKAVLIGNKEIILGSRYRKLVTDQFHQI